MADARRESSVRARALACDQKRSHASWMAMCDDLGRLLKLAEMSAEGSAFLCSHRRGALGGFRRRISKRGCAVVSSPVSSPGRYLTPVSSPFFPGVCVPYRRHASAGVASRNSSTRAARLRSGRSLPSRGHLPAAPVRDFIERTPGRRSWRPVHGLAHWIDRGAGGLKVLDGYQELDRQRARFRLSHFISRARQCHTMAAPMQHLIPQCQQSGGQ
jgi:hypothetical protein